MRDRRSWRAGLAIRTVILPESGIATSVLGLGCASLGSRIAPEQGRRMLDMAFEAGITWYDVAPSYGAGRAEEILAPFVASRRDRVFLCSKVGLLPPAHNGLMRFVYDAGRPFIGLMSGLKRRFRSIKATRNRRVPLTAALIEASITASLARLGTDHLDVYALHDPDPADLQRDDVLAALEGVLRRGLARQISMAGSTEAALVAARLPLFTAFQLADDPSTRPLGRLKAALDRPAALITHSVYGVGGARDRLIARLAAEPRLLDRAAAAGYAGRAEEVASRLLIARAFASNAGGVVLASMFTPAHLAANVAAASAPLDATAAQLVEDWLSPANAEHQGDRH